MSEKFETKQKNGAKGWQKGTKGTRLYVRLRAFESSVRRHLVEEFLEIINCHFAAFWCALRKGHTCKLYATLRAKGGTSDGMTVKNFFIFRRRLYLHVYFDE